MNREPIENQGSMQDFLTHLILLIEEQEDAQTLRSGLLIIIVADRKVLHQRHKTTYKS